MIISSGVRDTTTAVKNFVADIRSGAVVLPDDLADVVAGTTSLFPDTIIYNNKVVPTSYDPMTKIVSLRVA